MLKCFVVVIVVVFSRSKIYRSSKSNYGHSENSGKNEMKRWRKKQTKKLLLIGDMATLILFTGLLSFYHKSRI